MSWVVCADKVGWAAMAGWLGGGWQVQCPGCVVWAAPVGTARCGGQGLLLWVPVGAGGLGWGGLEVPGCSLGPGSWPGVAAGPGQEPGTQVPCTSHFLGKIRSVAKLIEK